MSEPHDGGPAFPAYEHFIADRHDSKGEVRVITGQPHGGMSLRDYFAAQALAGLLSNDFGGFDDTVGARAYAIADAMLKAREQGS